MKLNSASSTSRLVFRLGIACLVLVIFLLGAGSHKYRVHHEIRSYIETLLNLNEFEKQFDDDDSMGESVLDDEDPCNMRRVPMGYCPGPSAFDEPQYQKEFAKQLEGLGSGGQHDDGGYVTENYPELLAESLGYYTIKPAPGTVPDRLHSESVRDLDDGQISELMLDFEHPAVTTRSLFAEHLERPDDVLIILHGLNSNANKVMGLDNDDYLRMAGRYYYDYGMDTLAFDITEYPPLDSINNTRLRFYDATARGLYIRSVCDVFRFLELAEKYRRVMIYGLSSGSMLALELAPLCGPFSLIIADDGINFAGPSIWRDPENAKSGVKFGSFIDFLRPFHENVSFVDMIYHSRSPLYVIARPVSAYHDWVDTVFVIGEGVDGTSPVNFVDKILPHHVPEFDEVLNPIFERDVQDLEGFNLTAK